MPLLLNKLEKLKNTTLSKIFSKAETNTAILNILKPKYKWYLV